MRRLDEADSTRALITVHDLAIGFDQTPILENLEFDIENGEIFCILGGSGCGKSTLLRHLIGLDAPMRGQIEITDYGAPDLVPDRAVPWGVLFQSGALFGSMSVLDNVCLPLREWTELSRPAIECIARTKLALVDLTAAEQRLPSEISGGMRKRAGIARALALDPQLLYLDEPSAGLDPIAAAELDDLLLQLSQDLGVTIVAVTHELASVFKIADRVVMLDGDARGILAVGDPRVLRDESTNPQVRAFLTRQPGTGNKVGTGSAR